MWQRGAISILRLHEGHRGKLIIDGATQLEMIREHLGKAAVTVLDLDFSKHGNARPYLGKGWSGAEDDFTWSQDQESVVEFEAPSEPGQYALRMTTGAYLRKGDVDQQEMVVYLNDKYIAHVFQNGGFFQFHEVTFFSDLFAGPARARLRLEHKLAIRPFDAGAPDGRWLSFCFKRLTIARLHKSEEQR